MEGSECIERGVVQELAVAMDKRVEPFLFLGLDGNHKLQFHLGTSLFALCDLEG